MLCSSLDKIIEIFNLRQFSVYSQLCYCHSITIIRLKILCTRFTITLHKIELYNHNKQKPGGIDHFHRYSHISIIKALQQALQQKYKDPNLLVEYTFFP